MHLDLRARVQIPNVGNIPLVSTDVTPLSVGVLALSKIVVRPALVSTSGRKDKGERHGEMEERRENEMNEGKV